jgi:protein-tyrosine phosphatase
MGQDVDRWITFAGTVFNFRDLGGLVTADNRRVRPGRLFRADSLGGLVEQDRSTVTPLGLGTVIDLRQPTELEMFGRAPEWTSPAWHNIPMSNPAWRHEDYSPEAGVVAFLVARYHEMAEFAAADIVAAVRLIADPDSGPTVVHCLGGRDRTGVIIAFVLDLIGMADEVIAADYELTEQGMARYTAWQTTYRPDLPPLPPYLAVTPAEAMHTFLSDIRDRHGSVEAYLLRHGLSAQDIARLRTWLLED